MTDSSPQGAPQVLLIDDDAELAGLLAQRFARDGLALRHAATAAAGWAVLAEAGRDADAERGEAMPHLVLLDLMLPDAPGIELLRRLREHRLPVPVIVLTAKGDPVDRVVGLELGADDYVAKPFDSRELVARVRAVLRRAVPVAPIAPVDASPAAGAPGLAPGEALRRQLGAAVLDLGARTLTVAGREVPLTTLEFKLVVELARHPGQPRSREALASAVQVGNYRPLERAVDVQVGRLRRKLREIDPGAQWIVTARGEGYLWAPPA